MEQPRGLSAVELMRLLLFYHRHIDSTILQFTSSEVHTLRHSLLPCSKPVFGFMLFSCGVIDDEVSGQQCPAGHGGQKLSANNWSWSTGDVCPEVLDCKRGRPVHALEFLQRVPPLGLPHKVSYG